MPVFSQPRITPAPGDPTSTCSYPVCLAPFVEDIVLPPMCIFGIFVIYQMSVASFTHVWVFCFVSLTICLVLCQYCAIFLCMTL